METLNSSRLLNFYRTQSSYIHSSSRRSTNQNSYIKLSSNKYLINSRIVSYSLAWSNIIYTSKTNMGTVFAKNNGDNNDQSSAPTPGASAGKTWRNWLVGVIVSIVLPFASKWGRLLAIKNEVETVIKTAETVVETAEKVAEEVAHVSDDLANQLTEGGKLQNIVCTVANIAEETAKDAHLIDQFIEKVENVEEKLEYVVVNEVHEISTEVQLDEVSKEDDTIPVEELTKDETQGDDLNKDQPK